MTRTQKGARVRRSDPRSPGSGRLSTLGVLFIIAFLAVAVRLVWIQIVMADEYTDKATAQRMRDIELAPRRGTIYDREGEPLAVSVEAPTVYASPRFVNNKSGAAEVLASTLGGSKKSYLEKLERDTGFVFLARKVDLDRADELETRLERLDIKGIGFIEDFRRLYPSGDLACQVLGFVGDEDQGLEGIELQYDDTLSGTPGVIIGERDPQGLRPIPGGIQKEIAPEHGRDVVLTIDKDIQHQAQVELKRAVKKWGAKRGFVTIMNPKNGEIYAMATWPTFDPNNLKSADVEATRNRPLTDAYEPGSTFKCLTAAAAIDSGLFEADSMLDLPSTIKVGGRTIHEAHGRGAVRWSLTDIVTQSSNVGTVKVGLKLGKQGLFDSMAAFGVTEVPETDFPGTAKGWLPPVDQWSASTIGNVPFGQGVSLTQLQLSRAIGALANGGVLTTPHFLLDIPRTDADAPTWPVRRAVTSETAEAVTGMLESVVIKGTGTSAAVKGYNVAGKTGTAQKAREDGRGYSGGGYMGSFIGYLPSEDPQVLVCVTLDRPTNAIYGGVVAGPTFSTLAHFSVSHLKIPPSTPEAIKAVRKSVKKVSEAQSKD